MMLVTKPMSSIVAGIGTTSARQHQMATGSTAPCGAAMQPSDSSPALMSGAELREHQIGQARIRAPARPWSAASAAGFQRGQVERAARLRAPGRCGPAGVR
jgi:hypothetical protein